MKADIPPSAFTLPFFDPQMQFDKLQNLFGIKDDESYLHRYYGVGSSMAAEEKKTSNETKKKSSDKSKKSKKKKRRTTTTTPVVEDDNDTFDKHRQRDAKKCGSKNYQKPTPEVLLVPDMAAVIVDEDLSGDDLPSQPRSEQRQQRQPQRRPRPETFQKGCDPDGKKGPQLQGREQEPDGVQPPRNSPAELAPPKKSSRQSRSRGNALSSLTSKTGPRKAVQFALKPTSHIRYTLSRRDMTPKEHEAYWNNPLLEYKRKLEARNSAVTFGESQKPLVDMIDQVYDHVKILARELTEGKKNKIVDDGNDSSLPDPEELVRISSVGSAGTWTTVSTSTSCSSADADSADDNKESEQMETAYFNDPSEFATGLLAWVMHADSQYYRGLEQYCSSNQTSSRAMRRKKHRRSVTYLQNSRQRHHDPVCYKEHIASEGCKLSLRSRLWARAMGHADAEVAQEIYREVPGISYDAY